jgi:hypothetical protein
MTRLSTEQASTGAAVLRPVTTARIKPDMKAAMLSMRGSTDRQCDVYGA